MKPPKNSFRNLELKPNAMYGPRAFSFVAETGATPGGVVSSNEVTLIGRDGEDWPMFVIGDGSPEIQIEGGSWVTGGLAVNGNTLRSRLTSSSSGSVERICSVYGPNVLQNFSVTTTPLFSPSDLATLLRWWKMDNIAGADGDPIGTLVDNSTNAKDATASGGNRGTLKTGILNGQSVLRYATGTAGYQATDLGTDLASDNSHSWFFVSKPTLANYPVLVTYPYGAGWSYLLEFDTSGAFYQAASGSYFLWATGFADATWNILSAIKTGASTGECWKNGTQIVSSSGSIGTMAATSGHMQLLGYTPSASPGFAGDFAEAICLSNADSTEARKVEGYLAWKWGLQANLPGGHPYAGGPP